MAGCDGIVASGQMPYNSNWNTPGKYFFDVMRHHALRNGLAFVDLFIPIGGPSLSLSLIHI